MKQLLSFHGIIQRLSMSTMLEFAPVGEQLDLGLLMIHSKTMDGKARMCPLNYAAIMLRALVELHAGFQPRMDRFLQMQYKEEWMVCNNIILQLLYFMIVANVNA